MILVATPDGKPVNYPDVLEMIVAELWSAINAFIHYFSVKKNRSIFSSKKNHFSLKKNPISSKKNHFSLKKNEFSLKRNGE